MVIHGCTTYPCPRCHREIIEHPKLKAEIVELGQVIDGLVDALGDDGERILIEVRAKVEARRLWDESLVPALFNLIMEGDSGSSEPTGPNGPTGLAAFW